jgi:hypothetical protein
MRSPRELREGEIRVKGEPIVLSAPEVSILKAEAIIVVYHIVTEKGETMLSIIGEVVLWISPLIASA